MRKASAKDKDRVIVILTRSFADDPHVGWLTKSNEGGHRERLRILMEVAFAEALAAGEIYLTDDETGTALWKNPLKSRFSFTILLSQMRLVRLFGFSRVRELLASEKYTKRQYPKTDFLYLWLIGVLPEGRGKGNASELLDPILLDAERKNLPVYLETANARNVEIYGSKGFRVYHEWKPSQKDPLTVRFMRRQRELSRR